MANTRSKGQRTAKMIKDNRHATTIPRIPGEGIP